MESVGGENKHQALVGYVGDKTYHRNGGPF